MMRNSYLVFLLVGLISCIDSLQNITGQKVVSYRAPGFSIKKQNVWAFEVLHELGIKYDASIFPATREDGGFDDFSESTPSIIRYNGAQIKEFPMSINNFLGRKFTVTGGGYFRFFPYRLIRRIIADSNYTMTYFHPRDFDVEQPIIKDLGLIRKFKSYYGLGSAQDKLEKLLKDFEFIDVRTAVNNINWSMKPKYTLAQLSNANEPLLKH